MTIKQIFPTNILIKDWDVSDKFLTDLKKELTFLRDVGIIDLHDGTRCCFTDEVLNGFENVNAFFEMFVEGFNELACSYNKPYDLEELRSRLKKSENKFFHYNRGEDKPLHRHSNAIAFGVFYFDDCDNEKEGAILQLKDPSYNNQTEHYNKTNETIETKKGRMIIAPGYIAHEVSTFNPINDKNRETFVINLKLLG